MISCDVHNIDFDGVTYFAQSTGFPSKSICLTNTTDSFVQFVSSFINIGGDFSLKISLKPLDGNYDNSLTILRIGSQQSLNVELKFVPENLSQQYLNHHKCVSTINLPYTIEGSDEENVLPIKFSATLCTSVMFINQFDIDFQNCTMLENVIREFEVWNRSDCDLVFQVETGAIVSSITILDDTQINTPAVLFLKDCDSGIKLIGSHKLSIAPFASKRIKVEFQANVHGQFSATIVLTNVNNLSNVLTLFAKAVVQSALQKKEYFVELFGEDEPESNVLLLNADNDSASPSASSSNVLSHNFDVGDCYSGVKKLKRCWLRNTTAFRVEIMVVAAGDPNVGRPSGETQIFYVGDEVSMNPSCHLPDATFAYSQMVAAYNRSHSPDMAEDGLVEKPVTSAATLDASLLERVQKPSVDAGGRTTPQSILVLDSKRQQQQQQGAVITRSRNVSFSSSLDSIDVAKSTTSGFSPVDKEGDGLAVFAADQAIIKPASQIQTQIRPSAQSVQKDRPVGSSSAGFEVVESLHDKVTPWGLHKQNKVAKSSSALSSSAAPSSSTTSSGSAAGSGKSSTTTYANDHGVTCGKLWGDAGLCQSLVDDEECYDPADKSLSPAVVLGGAAAMEGGGISSKRFFNGKSSKSLLRVRNQKGGKKSGSTLSTLISPGTLDAKAPESFSLGEMSVKIENDLFAERREPQQNESPKANSSTLLSMTQENVCAMLVLEPFERRPCTLMVTPSADYFDSSGTGLGGVLTQRSLGLTLRCRRLLSSGLSGVVMTDEVEDVMASQDIRLSLRIRVCTSVVTVTPQLYDLGLCSVGEFRWVIFSVQNDSDLPALVYSFVQSETLSIPEPELFIAPHKSKQLKIEYVAHQENTQYNKKAMLLNVFNESNHNQVEIRAKNVDTQQVLLHSLFYKLITYNNKRQLQVYFERGLINMPNLRTFCVKNTHSAILRVQFTVERGRNLQLFQVKSVEQLMRDQSDVGLDDTPTAQFINKTRSIKQSRFNDFNFGDFTDENSVATQKLDKGSDPSSVSSFSPSVATTAMNQHIEDLKWGDENDANRLQRVSKSASMRMSGGGLDDEFHLTKSQKMSRLNQAPLSSDLDALDVNVSTITASVSTGSGGNNNSSTSVKIASSDNSITSAGRPLSENTALSTVSAGFGNQTVRGDDSSRLSPKVLKDGTEDSISVAKGSSQKLLDLVQELDKGDFPHSFLRQYSGNDDATEVDLEASRDSGSAKVTSSHDSSVKTQQEVERQVKAIQRTYTDLKALLDNRGTPNSCLVPLLEATGGDSAERESNTTSTSSDVEQSNSRSFVVDIPVGATFNFAVVLFPQQARVEDQDECHQIVIAEAIQIRLPQITLSDIDAAIKSTNQNSEVQLLSPHLSAPSSIIRNDLGTASSDPLKSRSMLVRAKAVRCEMIVIQKNISFGRTLVGDKTSRVVTLVNRSSIACLFSISKSGSISSGFLQIPQGRHGVIPAYSTKHVEFIFRPTLPGSFEETMLIENVLNPRNSQSIVVKAKVSKAESFVLLPHVETVPPIIKSSSRSALVTSADELAAAVSQILPAESGSSVGIGEYSPAVDSDSFYRALLDDAMMQIQKIGATGIGGNSSTSVGAPVFLGSVAVGEQCETVISFRIKNQTSKKRQFIVDSTHPTAVSLLAAAVLAARTYSTDVLPFLSMSPPRTRPPLKPTRSKGSLSVDSVTSGVLHSLPFEPFPEILQSVVSLSCTFSSMVWNTTDKGGKAGSTVGQESLSEEQRLILEDSLEKFQQKLKIAVRKNKADKIEKYQKKINKVIASLTGVKEDPLTGTEVDPSITFQPPIVLEPAKIEVGSVIPTAVPPPPAAAIQLQEESDVAHHFSLEPDQEKVIKVKLTFLPAASYSHWDGILPFFGFLRVFECRNEDTVKAVHFGAMIYSSRMAFGAAARRHRESLGDYECLPIDEEMNGESECRKQRSASQEFRAGARRLESKPSFGREALGSDEFDGDLASAGPSLVKSRDRLSLSSIVELQKVENSFLVTIAQWSSFPTKLIYPKYRQLPQNVLGMSVKLVQASKDRVMYGALSLASVLLDREAVIDLYVEDSFNVKSSSDYVSYNSKLHGAISFGLASSSASNDNTTSHLSYHDSVGSDEAVRYSESRIQTQVSAGGKLLFVVKWRPPVEEQRNELNLLGAFKVQCRVKDKVVGAEQFVPFICVREHKSVLRVERYSSFGDITVGSYRMASVAITNTSSSEDLHYLVSSEDLTASARAVGKVQINSGQTGVVPPSSSRTMSLLFSATSPGKFEQKLWIRNISDGFDQKRIAIQANVTITHAKFVTFPDLEHSLDSHEGKYKPIDLGLIQIQSQRTDATQQLANATIQQHTINDDFYRLRIENVSDKSLCVTAISNLKSQCFVYVDEGCTQLAVNHPMPQHACTTLFVLIRPAQLHSKSNDWIATAASKPSSGNLVGLTSSKTAVDLTAMSAANMLVSSSSSEAASKTPVSLTGGGGGRELKGGIRLVFFVSDPPLSEKNELSPSEVVQRKLFETALSFKAVVGKSLLKLKSMTPVLQCIKARVSDDLSPHAEAAIYQMARGTFEIRNDSSVFPLRYSYVVDSAADCVGVLQEDWVAAGEVAFAAQTVQKVGGERLKLLIADTVVGMLPPGQSRLVDYAVFYSSDAATARSGLGLFDIRMVNLSTKDTCQVKLGVFFDCEQVKSSLCELSPSETDDIPVLNVPSPIWLAGLDSRTRGKRLRRKQQRRNKNAGVGDPDSDVFESAPDSDGENESVGSSADLGANLLWYEITGAAANALCTCVIRNTHRERLLTLTPVSDLPIVLHTEPLKDNQEDICCSTSPPRDEESAGPWQTVIKQQNQLSSVVVGKWKRNICIRGDAFTLPPGCAVRVTMSAPRSMLLDEELVDDLQRGKLESGSQCKVSGIVAFLQSAHSLQSLFDQTVNQGGIFTPPAPANVPDSEKSLFGAASQLQSLFSPPPVSITEATEDDPPSRPAAFPDMFELPNLNQTSAVVDLTRSSKTQQFEVFPVLSIFKINCSFVVPKLQIPCSVFALGKLRGGYQTTVEITVVNLSEVDVPCSIECLPSWLTLHPSNFTTDGAFYFSHSTAGFAPGPSRDEEPYSTRTRKNTWTSLSSSTIDNIDSSTPIRSSHTNSLGAKKMQMWFNKNTTSEVTSPEVLVASNDMVGQLSDLSSLQVHQRRYAHNQSESLGSDIILPHRSSASSTDGASRLDAEGEEEVNEEETDGRSMTSLDVHHESVFAASLIDAIGTLDAGLLPPRYREGTTLFSAKRSGRTVIKFVAKAPFVETQRLEHKIRIKNLTSCSSSYFTSASDFEILVRLDVDSTRAVEVSGGPNDPLVLSSARARTSILSPKAGEGGSTSIFSPERNTTMSSVAGSTSMYRLLKEPFLVPPPVVAGAGVSDTTEGSVGAASPNRGSVSQQVNLKSELNPVLSHIPTICMTTAVQNNYKLASEAKTHCILFLKNNLSKPVRVTAVLSLNAAVSKVISLHVKFPQNSEQNDCLVLQPKETAEVKVRVSCRIGSRFSDVDSAQLMTYLLSNMNPEKNQTVGTGNKVDNVELTSVFASCGPILFGTVNFHPSVVEQEKGIQSVTRERSKSSDLFMAVPSGAVDRLAIATNDSERLLLVRDASVLSIALSESEDAPYVAPQDVMSVDIVGFLSAAPTVAVNRLIKQPICGVSTVQRTSSMADPSTHDGAGKTASSSSSSTGDLEDLLVFRVTEDMQTSVASSTGRCFRVIGDEQCFYLNNPSPNSVLNFSIKSGSYRHPGMQLFLPDVFGDGSESQSGYLPQLDEQGREGYYDTVTVQANPSRGTILPGGSIRIAVNMLPGVSGGSVRTASTMTSISDIPDKLIRALARGEKTSAITPPITASSVEGSTAVPVVAELPRTMNRVVLACMPLQISDEDWPQHPARRVFTYLISDSAMVVLPPALDTLSKRSPVSLSEAVSHPELPAPIGVEIGQICTTSSATKQSESPLTSQTDVVPSHQIRLRGVTPSVPRKVQGSCYLIDLKQQPQRKESIEWLVSVENCGPSSGAVPYTVFASNQSWLTVGQSRGSAAVGSSSDIMLYLSRANIGMYSGYVVVRNGLDAYNNQVIRVSMEVVSGGTDSSVVQRKVSLSSANQVAITMPDADGTFVVPTDFLISAESSALESDGFRTPNLFRCRVYKASDNKKLFDSSDSSPASIDILWSSDDAVFILELASDCDMPLSLVVAHDCPTLLINGNSPLSGASGGYIHGLTLAARQAVSIECDAQSLRNSFVVEKFCCDNNAVRNITFKIELPMFGESLDLLVCIHCSESVDICT